MLKITVTLHKWNTYALCILYNPKRYIFYNNLTSFFLFQGNCEYTRQHNSMTN